MKNFKSLLPFLLMVFALVGCDTDDLRNDVDELKNRVESLEAQVTAINENMNVLQVLVEGNKTIKSCVYDEATKTYKLVLSDDTQLELYQGEDGMANTPEITVSADNKWVINGTPTDVDATGADAALPKFKLDDQNYWMVDLDGDGTLYGYDYVYNEAGEKVQAVSGDTTGGDTFFESVSYNEAEGFLEVKLTSTPGTTYKLPVVPTLTCKINTENVEEYKNGVLTVGYGLSAELEVEVQGDNYFVTAPSGWTAVLGEVDPDTHKATLTVYAPKEEVAAGTLSRATADNSTDLSLQVNKGGYWAVAKIQVVVTKIISSYYAEWEAGNDIVIGQVGEETNNAVIINKTNFATAKLIDTDQDITEDGLFFIKDGINVSFTKGALKNSILIGDNPNNKTTVTLGSYLPIKGEGNGFIAKNIEFTGTSSFNYIAQTTDVVTIDNFILDNCVLEIPMAKNLLNVTKVGSTIKHIALVNSSIKMSSTNFSSTRLFNFTQALSCNSINIRNNVIYSLTDGEAVNTSFVYAENLDLNAEVKISNNTLINMIPSSKSLIIGKINNSILIQNNLIWTNSSTGRNATFVNAQNGSTNSSYTISDNIQYNNNAVINFNPFAGTTPSGQSNAKLVPITDDPFSGEGADFRLDLGLFVPNSSYAEYGAKLD